MGRGSLWVAVVLVGACTFGSPGAKGDGAASIADDGTRGGDDGAPAPADDGEAGGSVGMGTSTGASPGPTSGADTVGPLDPDDSASQGDVSTGDVDSSTSGTEGSVDSTTSGGSTDDGMVPGSSYPPCPTGANAECGFGNNCVVITDESEVITGTVCGEIGCLQCEPPASGNTTPFCANLDFFTCMLGCGGGATCPTGMSCRDTQIGDVCVWGQ
jgi:hypothetical protein